MLSESFGRAFNLFHLMSSRYDTRLDLNHNNPTYTNKTGRRRILLTYRTPDLILVGKQHLT
jgi:hypothetical protein